MQYLATPSQLAQILRSARKRSGLTQAQAAARAGISQSRLSVLESEPGSLTLDQLMAITAVYGLRIAIEDSVAGEPTAEW